MGIYIETQFKQCTNTSLTKKHEIFCAKTQKQMSSEQVFIVHNLVPLVPVGAFGAVLHGCKGRETAIKVNLHCTDTHTSV